MPRYKVDSALPDPVYIDAPRVVEIIPAEKYMSQLPALEGFDSDSPMATSVYCPPELRPIGNTSFHPQFAKMYEVVRIDTGEIIAVCRPQQGEIKVGDQVCYNIVCDDYVFFDPTFCSRKLTLMENDNDNG